MLNQEKQQFLRQSLGKLITQYEESISTLSFFNLFKKSEYNSFIARFKNLLIKLNDNENILEKMSLGEVATLRNISMERARDIKKIPKYEEDEKLVAEITLARECIIELSKELAEVDNAEGSGVQPF